MKIATIEARLNSTRLPGKVLMEIEGIPILKIIHDKAKRIDGLDEVIIATTNSTEDDRLVNFLEENNFKYFRGEEDDVWHRLKSCAEYHNADSIIKLNHH